MGHSLDATHIIEKFQLQDQDRVLVVPEEEATLGCICAVSHPNLTVISMGRVLKVVEYIGGSMYKVEVREVPDAGCMQVKNKAVQRQRRRIYQQTVASLVQHTGVNEEIYHLLPLKQLSWMLMSSPLLSSTERNALLDPTNPYHVLNDPFVRAHSVLGLLNHRDSVYCAHCDEELVASLRIHTRKALTHCYENPALQVFEIVVVDSQMSSNVKSHPREYEENSWFPGYSWSFVHCEGCGVQLGWNYNRHEGNTSNIYPKHFLGFILNGIKGVVEGYRVD